MLFFPFLQPAQSGPIKQWLAQFRAQSVHLTAEPVQKGLNFASVGVATTAHPPMPTPPPAQVSEQPAMQEDKTMNNTMNRKSSFMGQ